MTLQGLSASPESSWRLEQYIGDQDFAVEPRVFVSVWEMLLPQGPEQLVKPLAVPLSRLASQVNVLPLTEEENVMFVGVPVQIAEDAGVAVITGTGFTAMRLDTMSAGHP